MDAPRRGSGERNGKERKGKGRRFLPARQSVMVPATEKGREGGFMAVEEEEEEEEEKRNKISLAD